MRAERREEPSDTGKSGNSWQGHLTGLYFGFRLEVCLLVSVGDLPDLPFLNKFDLSESGSLASVLGTLKLVFCSSLIPFIQV